MEPQNGLVSVYIYIYSQYDITMVDISGYLMVLTIRFAWLIILTPSPIKSHIITVGLSGFMVDLAANMGFFDHQT